jgi:hypothetical protein
MTTFRGSSARIAFSSMSTRSHQEPASPNILPLLSKSRWSLLPVIGPHWLDITDARGNRRLNDPDDFVVRELRTALRNDWTQIVPVLVNGAAMPGKKDLPRTLAAIADRQALELHDVRLGVDMDRLTAAIRAEFSVTPEEIKRVRDLMQTFPPELREWSEETIRQATIPDMRRVAVSLILNAASSFGFDEDGTT